MKQDMEPLTAGDSCGLPGEWQELRIAGSHSNRLPKNKISKIHMSIGTISHKFLVG